MKLLLDTNVLLDVLLAREPHFEASALVWAAAERGEVEGLISAHAVTTIYFLVDQERKPKIANRTTAALVKVFGVAPVTGEVIHEALALAWPDFEDAVTAGAARAAGCDAIVTRDAKGFRRAPIPVFTPEAAAAMIQSVGRAVS